MTLEMSATTRNAGPPSDWKVQRLAEVADIRISNVDKKSLNCELFVRLCNYMDVYANEYIRSTLNFMQATANPVEIARFAVERGDVMLTKDSETPDDIGVPAVVTEDIPNLVCGYHLALIKPLPDNVDSIFLSKQIKHERIAMWFSRLANGSTRYGLSTSSFENLEVWLPELSEQRKIATILTTLDELIEKNDALIAKYQAIKQGMKHDLFTRGVDELGHLRPTYDEAPKLYKESELGWIPREWNVQYLSSLVELRFSNVDKKTQLGEIPVHLCNYLDVYENDYITNALDFMAATANPTEVARFQLVSGDILATKDSETPDDIGVPAVVVDEIPGLICGYHLVQIRPDTLVTNSVFLCKQIGCTRVARYFFRLANGSTRYGLLSSSFGGLLICVPTMGEQWAIADRLSRLDELLASEQRAVDKYQWLKRSLMQDLLTGKVRVKVNEDDGHV